MHIYMDMYMHMYMRRILANVRLKKKIENEFFDFFGMRSCL